MASLNYITNIPRFETSKLFYGKYPFSVTVDHKLLRNGGCETNRHIRHFKVYKALEWLCQELGVTDYRTRVSSDTTQIYLACEQNALAIIESAHKSILRFHAPRNPQERKILEDDTRLIIRDNLFWNHFRYRIVYRSMRKANTLEVEEFFADFLNFMGETERLQRFSFNYSDPIKVYIADEKDLLLVKIAHNDIILRIEKVILRNEIDAPEPIKEVD